MPELKYKRILLKVSGEALAGDAHRGLDFTIVNELCKSIKTCVDMGVQIGLVIGAGNFWRGVKDGADRMELVHWMQIAVCWKNAGRISLLLLQLAKCIRNRILVNLAMHH